MSRIGERRLWSIRQFDRPSFLKSGSGLGVLQAVNRLGNDFLESVVISNYATPDMRRKCVELGATRVFDKSTEVDGLIAYCSALAAKASART